MTSSTTTNGSRRMNWAGSRSPAASKRSFDRPDACWSPNSLGITLVCHPPPHRWRMTPAARRVGADALLPAPWGGIWGWLDPFMSKHFLAALIVVSCLCSPVRAQDAPAPFDNDLQRLAPILGTLHYLRGICGSNEGGKWRNEMQALIDAETPSGDRRARMIAGFNRGYNGFQQTYATRTPPRP